VVARLSAPLTGLHIQPGTRVVLIDGCEHYLTGTSIALLAHLAARRGLWVSSEELLQVGFNAHHDQTSSIVRVHVHGLRRDLGARRTLVESRRGRGYRLALPNSRAAETQ